LKGLNASKDIGLIGMTMKNYELLSNINYRKGRYKSAYEYYIKYSVCKDSVFNLESQQKFAEFQVLYETEKKENEIILLNNQKLLQQIQIEEAKQRFYFLIIILVLLLFLVGLFYYQYSNRKRINRLLSDKNIQLEQLNATKDRFISIIAHDLKNPFTAFYNITSALYNSKSELTQAERNRFIDSIYTSSKKLKELLNSLLEWARLQKDNLPVQSKLLNLKDITDISVSINETISKSKQIRILNKTHKNLNIYSHRETLLSVFNNLISNAIKFSPPESTVILSSAKEKYHIDVIVEDHGIGLSESEINKLFRIDVDPRMIGNSEEKGTGMGLILCKELLEKVQGSIKVESTPGKGSRFIVSLPANM